jgi:hypothetical protein
MGDLWRGRAGANRLPSLPWLTKSEVVTIVTWLTKK